MNLPAIFTEVAIMALSEHVFGSRDTCVCGHSPADYNDWRRHQATVILEAVFSLGEVNDGLAVRGDPSGLGMMYPTNRRDLAVNMARRIVTDNPDAKVTLNREYSFRHTQQVMEFWNSEGDQ